MPANPLGLTAAQWKLFEGAGIRLFDTSGVYIPDEEVQRHIDGATRSFEQKYGLRFYDKNEFADGIRFASPYPGITIGDDYDEAVDAQNFDVNYFTGPRHMHMTLEWGPILGIDEVRLSYPNRTGGFVIPSEWITHRGRFRVVQVAPGFGGIGPGYVAAPAAIPGILGFGSVPHAVQIRYRAGLEHDVVANRYPQITNMVYMKAGLDILNIAQNMTDPGVSSRSVGIDGVSQSKSLTQSAVYGLYSATIDRWAKNLGRLESEFGHYWNGIGMAVIA